MPEFDIPNMAKLGIARLHPLKHVKSPERILGYQLRLAETSVGKDTMTGHWEMMGLNITKPFKTYTDTGFPKELLDELSRRTGHKIDRSPPKAHSEAFSGVPFHGPAEPWSSHCNPNPSGLTASH